MWKQNFTPPLFLSFYFSTNKLSPAITDQNSKIYQLIHSPMRMGDVGEGYMWMMRLFPNQSNRIKVEPSQMFDSMIFVYKAKPIQIF